MGSPEKEYKKNFREWLEKMDKQLFKTRNKKRYKLISIRKKIIIYGDHKELIFRRYYKDLWTGKNVYLLDRWLKIKSHQHIRKREKRRIYKMVAKKKMTFSQVVEHYENNFSVSTVHRLIKNHNVNFRVNFSINPRKFKIIYINIDDGYRTLKIRGKWYECQFKVIQIYQSYIKEKKQFINELKAVLINKNKAGKNISTVLAIMKIKALLCKYYGDTSNYRIIVCGDGARNLKAIARALGAEFCLDKFHLYQKINAAFKTQALKQIDFICNDCTSSIYKKNELVHQIIELIETGKVAEAIQMLIDIRKKFKIHSTDLNKLIRYMKNNQKAIEIWKDPAYVGTFTETFVQQLVKSYFGNVGKWYSLSTFLKILRGNCVVNFLK